MTEPSENARMAPRRKRNRQNRPPQYSYLRPQLSQAETTLQALQQELEDLQSNHERLQKRLEAAVEGCEAVDERMERWVACHLGRHSRQLQHTQRRLLTTVELLPPPKLWSGRDSPLARWSSEELRFAVYGTMLSLQTLCRAGEENDNKLLAYANKCRAFAQFQLVHNPDSWFNGVKCCNFITGEPAPKGWYCDAIASIPDGALPAVFVHSLKARLARHRSKVSSILQRRAGLQRQLLQLLTSASKIGGSLLVAGTSTCALTDGNGSGSLLAAGTSMCALTDGRGSGSGQLQLPLRCGTYHECVASCHAVTQAFQVAVAGATGTSSMRSALTVAAAGSHPNPSPGPPGPARQSQGHSYGLLADPGSRGYAVTPAGDPLCQALELLSEIQATFAEQLWAQTGIVPTNGTDGTSLGTVVRVLTRIASAVLPYHMDIPSISEALCERFSGTA